MASSFLFRRGAVAIILALQNQVKPLRLRLVHPGSSVADAPKTVYGLL